MNQAAFFEALGWSLIDSLWQAGAIWIAYIFITANGSRYSADKRHTLALTGVMAGTLLFFSSIIINVFSTAANGSIISFAYFIEQRSASFVTSEQATYIVSLLPYIYLPVLSFYVLRTFFQLTLQRNNYRKNLLHAGDQLSALVNEIGEKLGLRRNAVLWLSEKLEGPLTVGFWKPVILLPVAVFSHLSYRQLEAVIAHELLHIKRNDYLLNIFLTIAETVLFFNPFAKMLVGIVKKERENRCDDSVLAAGFDAWEYSEALYILGRFSREQGKFSMAATGLGKEYLLQRIRRIMNKRNPGPSIVKPLVAFFLCLVVAGSASRTRNVPVLSNLEKVTEGLPVVYYSVEKRANVEEPVVIVPEKIVEVPRINDVPAGTGSHSIVVPDPVESPAPPESPEPLEPEDVLVTTFVNNTIDFEFTLIDHEEPLIPDVVCETPQPYVPKSTFYFTEVDTLAGKKVISL